jgi:hypothetical protein
MMRKRVNELTTRLYPATTELIDDGSVCYSRKASAQHEDPPSESFRTGEPNSVSNVESSSHAQHDSHYFQITLKPAPLRKCKKAQEEISMYGQRLRIDIVCRPILMIIALVIFGVISAAPVAAQLPTADFIDWDLPQLAGAGQCPSAIGAVTLPPTGDPVYYVTRCPGPSRNKDNNTPSGDPAGVPRIGPALLRFFPGTPLGFGQASWRAWNLGNIIESTVVDEAAPALGPTGGMKITRDESVAFIRASTEIIRVKMNSSYNNLTRWVDIAPVPDPDNPGSTIFVDPSSVSDLALVERKYCNVNYIDVYTTHNAASGGVVQRLTVQNGGTTATVKRWNVGTVGAPEFLRGVAYFSGNGRIYFSDAALDAIGELDPNTNKVRRWSLAPVLAAMPRQISIDSKGIIWVITGSGHLVSLNPCTNDMASYMIPGGTLFSFGLGTSGGTVGFTQGDNNIVGMLIPNKTPLPVSPTTPAPVSYTTTCLTGATETVFKDTGFVDPVRSDNVPVVPSNVDGEFLQAMLPREGNFPLGIFRDVERCVGNFYLLVTLGASPTDPDNNHRLTHVAFDLSSTTSGGLVTGGGTIGDSAPPSLDESLGDPDDWFPTNKANFGFNVYRMSSNAPIKGNFNYQNHTTGEHVKSVAITTLDFAGDTATFSGTCTKNQNGIDVPCQFSVTVHDGGNPGKGKDSFYINGLLVTPNGDTLNGGNIKIHR